MANISQCMFKDRTLLNALKKSKQNKLFVSKKHKKQQKTALGDYLSSFNCVKAQKLQFTVSL